MEVAWNITRSDADVDIELGAADVDVELGDDPQI
jgi:hypothetical protein